MTAPDPPPAALRDVLTDTIAGAMCSQEEAAEAAGDESWWGWGTDQIADFLADAILSDPRIAVIQLPEVVPRSPADQPHELEHVKLPHATDEWDRVERCDGQIRLNSISNPFRTDTEAADTAAAILAILNINRGDPS